MVQADEAAVKLVRRNGKAFCCVITHIDGYVAKSDTFYFGILQNRFCNDTGWIGEVDKPCILTDLFHIAADGEHDGNGTECFEESTGTGCLLADYIIFKRDPLILFPGIQTTYTDLCDNKGSVLKTLSSVECVTDRNGKSGLLCHTLCKGCVNGNLFFAFWNIDQDDLCDRKGILVIDDAFH